MAFNSKFLFSVYTHLVRVRLYSVTLCSLVAFCSFVCFLSQSHFGQVYDAPEGRSILILYEWDATEHEIYNFCCAFSRSMM